MKILQLQREDAIRDCRKHHNEKIKFVLLTKHFSSNHNKNKKMSGTGGAQQGEEHCTQGF
jgi:hypothetical protein